MEKSVRRGRKALFYVRGLECVLAAAIVAITLGSALPLSRKDSLMVDIGLAGPVVPIFAMFSNIAVNRRSMRFWEILTVYILCASMYFVAVAGTVKSWPLIKLNESKYYIGQQVKLYAAVIMFVILMCEATLMAIEKLTGKFTTDYRT